MTSNLKQISKDYFENEMYDGMLDDENKGIHDGIPQQSFENWKGDETIRVVFINKKWIQDNVPDWDIVSIKNIGFATEEIILKKK